MGPSERRARERDEVRARILDTARDLFAAEGYDAVTMRRIAERIEYSATAIYSYFRDKDALIAEICDADFRKLAQQFSGAAALKDPIERLRAAGHAYIRFGLEHPNHYRLMFMTPHPSQAGDHELDRGNPEEDAYAFLQLIVGQALREGRFKPGVEDVELISQTVWGAVHGVISLHIAKCNDDWVNWRPLEARAAAMIDAVIDGLSAR